jgi:hypothetical protein
MCSIAQLRELLMLLVEVAATSAGRQAGRQAGRRHTRSSLKCQGQGVTLRQPGCVESACLAGQGRARACVCCEVSWPTRARTEKPSSIDPSMLWQQRCISASGAAAHGKGRQNFG